MWLSNVAIKCGPQMWLSNMAFNLRLAIPCGLFLSMKVDNTGDLTYYLIDNFPFFPFYFNPKSLLSWDFFSVYY
jgi:hypothetical protein